MTNQLILASSLLIYTALSVAQSSLQHTKIPIQKFLPEIIRTSASPENPSNILLSVYGWDAINRSAEVRTFSSFDGGRTFSLTLLDTSTQWVSEVSNAFGPGNNAYIIAGASKRSGKLRGHTYGQMNIFHSQDGGKTWQNAAKGPFMDWTAATADAGKSTFRNRLYILGFDIANDSGGWSGPRKPLIYSTDNGNTISKPLFTGKWPDDGGGYPLAARVTNKGWLVVLYKRNDPAGLLTAISKDGGETLDLLPVIKKDTLVTARNIFDAGFDLDNSDTKFNGRCYVTYAAVYNGRPGIMLGYSDDFGKSWDQHVAAYYSSEAKEQDLGGTTLAVNKDGTIGIMWYEPAQQVYQFMISRTRGASFEKPILVSRAPSLRFDNMQFFENQLQTIGTYEPDEISTKAAPGIGLSIRILPVSSALSVVADASGGFHLFWTEQQANGDPALVTSIVSSSQTTEPVRREIITRKLVNIDSKVIIDIRRQQFDASTGVFTLGFTLTNASDSAIYGPVYVELANVVAGFGFANPRLLNIDTLRSESGNPVIDLTATEPDGQLAVGAATSIYTISFTVLQTETTDTIWRKVQSQGGTVHPISCLFNAYRKAN